MSEGFKIQCKRPPSYSNQLSVLDFRRKKPKMAKTLPSSKLVIVQTPTPTASETLGSSTTSPREDVQTLTWDAAEFTTALVEKCADLLLGAVEDALGGDESDEFDDDLVEVVRVAKEDVGAKEDDVESPQYLRALSSSVERDYDEADVVSLTASDDSEIQVLQRSKSPIAKKDDDETDDEWRPISKPTLKKNKEAKKPQTRRRSGASDLQKTPASTKMRSVKKKRSYDESIDTDEALRIAEGVPSPFVGAARRARKARAP